MNIIRKVKSLIARLFNIMLQKYHLPPPIMSNEETVGQLIAGKSLARFGDGEMMLILEQGDIAFQSHNPLLRDRLEEVLSYVDDNFLVGLPRVFTDRDLSNRNYDSKIFWVDNLMSTRREWYKRISFSHRYADSTFTRNYLTLKDKSSAGSYFNLVKSIWKSRKVLIIEGVHSRVGVGNDLFANTSDIKRILCPSTNAFSVYDEILRQACTVSKDYLVLIALGPTATVLAYDLFQLGYQAIDIGHIDIEFEWYLRGSESREQIAGKWVSEAGGMEVDTLANCTDYLNEIIAIVGEYVTERENVN